MIKKRILFISLHLFLFISAGAQTAPATDNPSPKVEKLNLFSDEMKKTTNGELLEFIEEALYKRVHNKSYESDGLILIKGKFSDFTKITPDMPVRISNFNASQLVAEWKLNGQDLVVAVPIGYHVGKGGSRSEIEDNFIEFLKTAKAERKHFDVIDAEDLVLAEDSIYTFYGASYQSNYINRNVYFTKDDVSAPVWDSSLPAESVSNLFIFPSDNFGNKEIEIRINKHEPGKTDTFILPLNSFLAACEQQGCIPFWGLEKLDGEKLQGALFLYNPQMGYNHVFKIEMDPRTLTADNGKIRAKGSLFIPTNNISDLFEPFQQKKDRIKLP